MLAHLAACLPGTSFLRWVRHERAEQSRPAPAGITNQSETFTPPGEGRVVEFEDGSATEFREPGRGFG